MAVGLLYTHSVLLRPLMVYWYQREKDENHLCFGQETQIMNLQAKKREEKVLETSVWPCQAGNRLKFHL